LGSLCAFLGGEETSIKEVRYLMAVLLASNAITKRASPNLHTSEPPQTYTHPQRVHCGHFDQLWEDSMRSSDIGLRVF
jgi:hypothetical protein